MDRNPHSPAQQPNVDGILNLNKPKGWTSHDVVARVRRLTGVRRVGHAGTLDPMATGVLLVCLGRATRIAEFLMAGRKHYRAVICLGVSTDSHDADGSVTATSSVEIGRSQVESALGRFRGSIEQVPPMVSAIKRDGQPLYRLARRGITVDRAPRQIEIFQIALTDWFPPSLTVELTCSPGTYVRALARDLGQRLGCGAHLTALTRLGSGSFTLSNAIELEQFDAAVTTSGKELLQTRCRQSLRPAPRPTTKPAPVWHALVMPMDTGLEHFPACHLDAHESRQVRSGQPLAVEAITAPRDTLVRVYAANDTQPKLLALLRFDTDAGLWRPHKVFYPL